MLESVLPLTQNIPIGFHRGVGYTSTTLRQPLHFHQPKKVEPHPI